MAHSEDLGGPATQVVSDEVELLDAERVDELEEPVRVVLDRIGDVERHVGLAAAEQVDCDHVVVLEQRGNILPDEGVRRDAVNEDDRLTAARAVIRQPVSFDLDEPGLAQHACPPVAAALRSSLRPYSFYPRVRLLCLRE